MTTQTEATLNIPVADLTTEQLSAPGPDHVRLVRGWPNYTVTDEGDVWSLGRGGGKGTPIGLWSKLSPSVNTGGYLHVNLHEKRRLSTKKIHRLVLEAFVGLRSPDQVCRHMNGDCRDNRLSNLCWGTQSENYADSARHGTSNCGSRAGNAKLTDEDVREIRCLVASGENQTAVAAKFGVGQQAVSKIYRRVSWAHLDKPPPPSRLPCARRCGEGGDVTDDQKAAFIMAQAAVLNAQVAGMVAENDQRKQCDESMAYGEGDFDALVRASGCDHNSVMAFMQ